MIEKSLEILESSSSDENELDENELFREDEFETEYKLEASKSPALKENDSSSDEIETKKKKIKRVYKNLRKGIHIY